MYNMLYINKNKGKQTLFKFLSHLQLFAATDTHLLQAIAYLLTSFHERQLILYKGKTTLRKNVYVKAIDLLLLICATYTWYDGTQYLF